MIISITTIIIIIIVIIFIVIIIIDNIFSHTDISSPFLSSSLSLSNTQYLSFPSSLFLSHTHTHINTNTHYFSVSLSLFLSLYLYLHLSLSFSLFLSLSIFLSLSLSLSHSLCLSDSHSHSYYDHYSSSGVVKVTMSSMAEGSLLETVVEQVTAILPNHTKYVRNLI